MFQLTKRRVFIGASMLASALAISYRAIFQIPLHKDLFSGQSPLSNDDPYTNDKPIEVIIPSCQDRGDKFRIKPLPYDNAEDKTAWYDLANPKAIPLDAVYKRYEKNLSGGVYGREHIYEVQLIALFIDSLSKDENNHVVWNWGKYKSKFCDWVQDFLLTPYQDTSSIVDEFRRCLPHNSKKNGPWMPLLAEDSNGIKASAWNGEPIRSEPNFRKSSDDEKVGVMRATAGLKSYMRDPKVKLSFDEQNVCVQAAWISWHMRYSKDSSVDPEAQKFDVGKTYVNWIAKRRREFDSNLSTGFNNMLGWWNGYAGGPGKCVKVLINWFNDLNNGKSVEITGTDLSNMWTNA